MQFLPEALAPLAAYRQFILYILVPSMRKPGKMEKLPVDYRTGRVVEKGGGGAHDQTIWTDAATAIACATYYGASYGVGFVFTVNDPFWFLDIDACRLPDGSNTSFLATELLRKFNGAAVEESQSRTGFHIIGVGQCPPHGKRNELYGLELYTERRFVALTGINASGSAAADFSHLLPNLVGQFFPWKPGCDHENGADWTDKPCDEWRGPTDDADLIERALRSQSAASVFSGKAAFRDLWEGNLEALVKTYPPDPNSSTPWNESGADRALAQHLAFWTGKDCERIQRLMQQSKLVRQKWEREDYLPRTILGAVATQRDVLTDKAPELPDVPRVPESTPPHEVPMAKEVEGDTYLGSQAQIDMFKGCVYVTDVHRILVPGGALLKPEQFRVMFGGYVFTVDQSNQKTTRDAFEAFTQNQCYRAPRADGTCFRPNLPPAALVRDAGRVRVNVFWPVDVPRKVGDVTPFMRHLEKLLPNEHDREILLAYMCACVQHQGIKFQWAPLLQGVEGNGKTLLTRCVAEAIGKRYVHWPKASKLAAQFNGWMLYNIFYGVEDIYVPGAKREIIEELKPMITGKDLEIEKKGIDQQSADICGNFMFNSNHKDAVVKTRKDRRYGVMYTAQQTADDLKRDGMYGAYFPNLYGWLEADGYAIVAELLHTRPIPDELNPAKGCNVAPVTSSTEEAIGESFGAIEQEIIEAIYQERQGFVGGWISSTFLSQLLEEKNLARRAPINKRRELMDSLGYHYHPALKDGRVNNLVLPDGNKPRLFIRDGHPHINLASPVDVERQYNIAQSSVVLKR